MAQDLEARVAELEARVRELLDREAIRELRSRYHELVNTGGWADIPELFSEDAELDFGYLGQARGRARIGRFFARGTELLPFVKQFIHNHVIDLSGERGTGTSYLEAKSVSGGRAYVVAGRYDDAYVREDGRWRFARMDFEPFFTVPFDEGWAQDDLLQMGRR